MREACLIFAPNAACDIINIAYELINPAPNATFDLINTAPNATCGMTWLILFQILFLWTNVAYGLIDTAPDATCDVTRLILLLMLPVTLSILLLLYCLWPD